jgi:diaminohydroxyphosphoribosylaminopyrimidine deaminase/5-amino-6-(5-phosphoribosylamino)uracil reductase
MVTVEPDDHRWLELAVDLARRCPPSDTAYSVGAVLVGADGVEIARGWSRDTDATVHAEESVLRRAAGDPRLPGATLYSSLEPCSRRASRPVPCARLVLDASIRRVVLAWREPDLFVPQARGADLLAAAGVTVVELPDLAAAALAPNAHLPLGGAR